MSEWALDTIDDIVREDPLRLLDLENDTQVLLSKIPGAKSESERAKSNFNKLVYNEHKPIDEHILEAAGRAIPNVVAIGGAPLLKLGADSINRAGRDFVKKAITARMKSAAVKKAQKNMDSTLLKNISRRLHPERMSHYMNAKYAESLSPEVSAALKTFDTSVDRAIRERMERMPGDITSKYSVLLQEAPSIAKKTNIPEENVVRAIKNEADALYRKPLLGKLNFKIKIENDIAANPDIYKGLSREEADALYRSRKAESSSIKNTSAFFNTNISMARQAPDAIDLSAVRDATAREIVSHAPRVIDMMQASVEKPIVPEREYKQFLFDRPPETSPIKDVLRDIIGVDYYNPNRWRQEDVEWFLKQAQDEGLLSDDSWKQWTPRQKVYKMREIAESPMAITFMRGIRE